MSPNPVGPLTCHVASGDPVGVISLAVQVVGVALPVLIAGVVASVGGDY